MDTSIQPQFSGTFGVWTDQSSVEKWASSLAVSPASHSQLPENNSERKILEIFGGKRGELFLRWDPNGSCWRTCQLCFTAMDETGQPMGEPFLETLPKWTTISNMELRVLPMPEPPISGNGSGSWPTPTATERSGTNPNTGRGAGLWKEVKQWPTPTTRDHKDGTAQSCANVPDNGLLGRVIHTADAPDNSGVLSPDWTTWLMGLPQNWVTLEPVSEESFAEWETRMADGSWWEDEHDLPRTVPSRKGRVDMLKALGNGIVPRTIQTFLNYARSN